MSEPPPAPRGTAYPPSVDAVLRLAETAAVLARFGRPATLGAIRAVLAALRADQTSAEPIAVLDQAADWLARSFAASQRPVFNLTGTVLHTNLGRSPLPPEAAAASRQAAITASVTTPLP